MTTPVIDQQPISAHLLDQLRVGTADAAGAGGRAYEWGDNAVPPPAEKVNPPLPYGIHYDLPGTFQILGVDGVQADGQFVVQETIVGATAEQVRTLADRARGVLTAIVNTIVGDVQILRVESDGVPPVTRVGPLFQTAESFTVYLSYETLDTGG